MKFRRAAATRKNFQAQAKSARERRIYVLSQLDRDCLLEDRTLLSVTAYVQAHTLFVSGGATTDSVMLDVVSPKGGPVGVEVVDNGTPVAGSPFAVSQFSSLNVLMPGSLTIQSGTFLDPGGIKIQSDAITVDTNVTLSTRQIAAGANPLTATSIGNSAPVTLTAPDIQVGNGVHILANANGGFTPADVTLTANDEATLNFALGLTGFKDVHTSTSIAIGSATIEAKDVVVTALSSTAKTLNLTQNLNDSRSVVEADLTGDGHKDLIVANDNGPVQIYLNNGTADPFNGVTPIDLTNSSPTVGLAVGDVIGNGRQDLIVANQGAPTVLYLNSGSKTNPFGGVAPIAIANVNATSVAVADVTGDGRADLIIGVMSTNPKQLTPSLLFLNSGNAKNPFGGSPISIAGADYVTSLTVANLNGDALPDLVVGQSGLVSNGTTSGEPTRVFLNTGSAGNPFGDGSLNVGATDLTTTAVAVADLNGDSHPDLIIGHDGEPTQLFLNGKSTTNPFGGVTPQNITISELTTSLTVADVNKDGHPDLIVGNFGVPTQLYLNNGSATKPFSGVTPQSITANGDDTASVAVGDLNNDGNPDLFVGLNGDFPRVYLNNQTATPFTTATDSLDPEPALAYQADESAVFKFHLLETAILATSASGVTVASGANIVASANVTLDAQAITNAQAYVSGTFLGGAYADSEPTARASVAGGAIITAGGSFDLSAITQNTVNLLTLVPSDASPGTVTFSYEKARSNSTANIAAGAVITAGSASINAINTNLFSNVAKSLGLQSTGAASFGVAVAIGDVQSFATASVLGGGAYRERHHRHGKLNKYQRPERRDCRRPQRASAEGTGRPSPARAGQLTLEIAAHRDGRRRHRLRGRYAGARCLGRRGRPRQREHGQCVRRPGRNHRRAWQRDHRRHG